MTRAGFVALLSVATACASPDDGATIRVTGVVAPAPIVSGGGSSPMALYATIVNHTDRDDTLLAIETPVAASASIHETVRRGGMATMAPVAYLVIPADSTIRLAPAGMHGMLDSLARPIVSGDSLSVTFVFNRQRRILTTARVVSYDRLEDALRSEATP